MMRITRMVRAACLGGSGLLPTLVMAADGAAGPEINWNAVVMFLIFVAFTLVVTRWAALRTHTAADFYAAGGGITGWQNGLAIAGDYMSAASFLGISALVYNSGFDGLIYSVGFLVGWPIILFLIAERLRNLGKYTFADVASFRLQQTPVRTLSAVSSLVVVLFYLIAQVVGAGSLIALLFPFLEFSYAVILVGALMIIYVTFGGMKATTWVQIIKACLLLAGASFMALMVLIKFDFNFGDLFTKAVEIHPKHLAIMSPGALVKDPISAISLGMALMFGTAGLPHILMRFFTVPDAKEARKSVLYATSLIGYFYILTFIIGFGAIVFVRANPAYFDAKGGLIGGNNMPAIYLADALGGSFFLGFIAAVAFATILAVVSGLTLAGASAISHDLYANVFARGKSNEKTEVFVSKIATIGLGIVAVALGIAFRTVNVAFMVALAFTVAASTNFPVLVLSMFWRGLTTKGAVIGGLLGLISAVGLIIAGPLVWKTILGNPTPLIPYDYPAIFSIPLAFIGTWFFSIIDNSAQATKERDLFDGQLVRSETGLGAEQAASH